MTTDLLMNDTFENFNFTISEEAIDKQKLNGNTTSITHTKNVAEVSFDDSIFLSEVSFSQENKISSSQKEVVQRSISQNKGESDLPNTNISDVKQTYNVDLSSLRELSSWGLPEAVLTNYHSKNLKTMFQWQVECLNKPGVLDGKNLVYSAPTSAGKTLVAELIAVKTILQRKKKVLFILPFVSIVREKMFYFQNLLESSGVRVDGFMGSYNPPGGFSAVQLAVCTIEKANSLVNRLLEEQKLEEIGALLIDEIHLLGDPSRGYLLELLLTKLKYIAKKQKLAIQIIGMSATLPNLSEIANWLQAELYTTDFRPVPLNEQVQVCGEVFDRNLKMVRKLQLLPGLKVDSDNILQLCLETIRESCSVLIFCPTKNWCESLAQQIASGIYQIGNSKTDWGTLLRAQLDKTLIIEVLEQLKYCPVGIDEILRKTVSLGVAFHHAGLTMDERDIVEGAFRSGALRVLIATSTLSSGVNLPARRVIIRTPIFHGKPLDSLVYRQMIGRAGRMGKDSIGESYLICQKTDFKIGKELITADLKPVQSCLESAGKLKRAILEIIASGVASTPDDVQLFTESTLLAEGDKSCSLLGNPIQEALEFLLRNEFVRLQNQEDGEVYIATSLGKACLSSSIAPDEGLSLFTELEKARQCLVLETELHLIYLVTPYSACYSFDNIDWMFYLNLWENLPRAMKKVGDLVGVQDVFLVNATRGKLHTNTEKSLHRYLIHKRFFVALALQDLVNEKPLNWVCKKFSCNRGMLQSLQQSASSFAGMVTSFSRQLGWSSMELLLAQFQQRMQFGVSRDLLDLMQLTVLNGKTARSLYNSGIETVIQLANSDISIIENILHRVVPFETEKHREGESEYDRKQRKKCKNVWINGREGLTEREAAEIFVKDARRYLTMEMGLLDAKWDSEDEKITDTCTDNKVKKITDSCTDNKDKKITAKRTDNADKKIIDTCTNNADKNITDKCTDNKDRKITDKCTDNKDKTIPDKCTDNKDKKITDKCIENKDKEITDENGKLKIQETLKKSPKVMQKNISIKKTSVELHGVNKTSLELEGTNKICLELNGSQSITVTSDESSILSENLNISDDSSLSISDSSSIEDNKGDKNIKHRELLIAKHSSISDISDTSSFSSSNSYQIENNRDIKSDQVITTNQNKHITKTPQKLVENFGKITISSPKLSQNLFKEAKNILEEITFSDFSETLSEISQKLPNTKVSPVVKSPPTETTHIQSDSSLFDESFTLLLSDDGNDKTDKSDSLEVDILENSLDDNDNRSGKKRKQEHFEEYSAEKKACTVAPQRNVPINEKVENKFGQLEIVNVCQEESVFETFAKELKKRRNFSFSIACSKHTENLTYINPNFGKTELHQTPTKKFVYNDRKIEGFAFSWSANIAYYVSLQIEILHNKIVRLLKSLFKISETVVTLFDSKEQIKMLQHFCELNFYCNISDPKIADWLLDPEGKQKNLKAMVMKHCPEAVLLSDLSGNCKGIGSIGLDIYSSTDFKIRASLEAILSWHLDYNLKNKLGEHSCRYLSAYEFENKVMAILAKIELDGFNINKNTLENLFSSIKVQMSNIEKKAFGIAGRKFNFASTGDVGKVTGLFKGRKVSTRKEILEKNQNPIADLILQWRKLNSIRTKIIFPLLEAIKNNRIHGCYVTHTSTGRITMHEPNLQNINRDFDVSGVSISCREVFEACEGCELISADYCQLELRILAHFSEDKLLCKIMNGPGDVFKTIGAEWNRITDDEVTDDLRQKTKHLCYGIIYGMGSKSMANQMNVDESTAIELMETFRNTYPGIKSFTKKTIERCRECGYVETLIGRKRYLSHISDEDNSKRTQAERQAVNTIIQGSAADLVKTAMIKIDSELLKIFQKTSNKPKMVLHLHDELIYEVPCKYIRKVAKIIKNSMESSFNLTVSLPVKLKTGKSWGKLNELFL